jgi:iron complex outermembrane receptor protein
MKIRGLLFTTMAFGMVAAVPLTPAMAQEVAAGEAAKQSDDSVIVVTARRREENIQQVPISITALTADALRDQNA